MDIDTTHILTYLCVYIIQVIYILCTYYIYTLYTYTYICLYLTLSINVKYTVTCFRTINDGDEKSRCSKLYRLASRIKIIQEYSQLDEQMISPI